MSIVRPLDEDGDRASRSETLEGYVVDIACARNWPRRELLERARKHGRNCLFMGHCIESGYAVVSNTGELSLLDPAATPLVMQATRSSSRKQGIRVRISRELQDGEMKTTRVTKLMQPRKNRRPGTYMEERVPPYAG